MIDFLAFAFALTTIENSKQQWTQYYIVIDSTTNNFSPILKQMLDLLFFWSKTTAEMIYKISAWRVKKTERLPVNRVARVYTAQKHVVGR